MSLVYQGLFLLRVLAPEGEDDGRLFFVDLTYDGVGESLPAAILVRVRHSRAHREHGVKEQHALLGPRLKGAVVGYLEAYVALQLREHVLERGRDCDAGSHGEGEAVGLVRAGVRVLAE